MVNWLWGVVTLVSELQCKEESNDMGAGSIILPVLLFTHTAYSYAVDSSTYHR